MPKTKAPRIANVRTTTVSVTKPVNFGRLESEFKLVRYIVPDRLRASTTGKTFERIHAQLKEQLDYPYKSYRFDKVDGPERWAVYVLYPKSTAPLMVKADDVPMEWQEVEFGTPEFHLLLKLLQVQYFCGSEQGKFVGRDSCYVYARRDGKTAHVCMQIDLIGDLANQDANRTQLFKVTGSAHKFVPPRKAVEAGKQYVNSYYAISRFTKEGTALFQQVKPSQIIDLSKKGNIYEQKTFEGKRATLDYYSLDAVERSRGYLLDAFIAGFSAFLAIYEFDVQTVERQFTQFQPIPEVTKFELPLEMLGIVNIYDMRKQRAIPIEEYQALFQNQFPKVKFEVIKQLIPEFNGVLLFIMDFAPEAYDEEMPFYGEQDPYKDLYEQFPNLPKQGLNVNSNDLQQTEDHENSKIWYLNYQMLDVDDKNIRNRIAVSMNQLFLKDIVMRSRSVSERLPGKYPPYIFVRKQTQNGTPYEVALYFDKGIVRFLDLRNPAHREVFVERLQTFNVVWDANYRAMSTRYRKEDGAELRRYDLIIGADLFVEIEDLNERVLYEFDEITERQGKKKVSLPLADFKLSNRYDDLRLGVMLSQAELLRHGLIDGEGNVLSEGQTNKQKQSVAFYVHLRQYDDVLDEMALQYPEISFKELCEHEYWLPRIAQAFSKKPDGKGKYQPRFLKDLYKRIDMFPTDREGELTPTYQGIWYDNNSRFIVGDVNSLKLTGQAKAHLVRQFVIYQGKGKFKIETLLDATSVRFVRLNQFTVYPYFFHLIDLYIENVLQYMALD